MPGRELQIIESDDIYEEYNISDFDRKFLDIYLSAECNHNARLAMCLAMYGHYPDDLQARQTASTRAHRLLSRIEIKKALVDLRKIRLLKYEEIIHNLIKQWQIASNFDPATLLDDEGNMLPLQDMPDEIRPMIEQIETVDGGVRLKFQSKQKAQELLAKAVGLLGSDTNNDKNNNGDGDFANILAKIEDKEHVQ